MVENGKLLLQHEKERDDLLRETGNWLHTSVPISNDEVSHSTDGTTVYSVCMGEGE